MRDEFKVGTTIPIWFFLCLMVVIVSFRVEGGDIIPVLIFSLMAGIMTTGFIWNWGQQPKINSVSMRDEEQEAAREKRKRQQLDEALRTLSDDQLEALRHGLSSGTITEDRLEMMLSDDGELVEFKGKSYE